MKKIIFFLLFCSTIVGCSFNNKEDVNPKANAKSMNINDYLTASDGSNIAISTDEGNYIYNAQNDTLERIELESGENFDNYYWNNNGSGWKFVKAANDFAVTIPDEKLVFSEKVLEGEIYDQRNNIAGVLEFRLINWQGRKVLALVNRKNGEFNIIGNMDGASSINIYNFSSEGAIIKISYNEVSRYWLYFKSIGKLTEINTSSVKGFHDSLTNYFGGSFNSVNGKFYKRDINFGDFEVIDLSCKNNLVLYIENPENSTKKLMAYDIKTEGITQIKTDGILNAVALNNNEIYVISKEDKKFNLEKINVKKEEYNTIFVANEFLYKLWEYDNKIYLGSVITEPNGSRHKFYRVFDGKVENIFSKQEID